MSDPRVIKEALEELKKNDPQLYKDIMEYAALIREQSNKDEIDLSPYQKIMDDIRANDGS